MASLSSKLVPGSTKAELPPARREVVHRDVEPVRRHIDVEPAPRLVAPVYTAVRWPGVWAGFLIALGLAVGATSVSETRSAQPLAQGAPWWAGVSLLVALFIGGAVSARWVAGGLTSVLQGALVWVLAVTAVMALASFGITLGANGLFAGLGTRIVENPALSQMAGAMSQNNQVGTTGTIEAVASMKSGAWITFIVLCVSALAAILGAVAGRQKEVRTVA